METTSTSSAAQYRDQLGRGADTGAGARELASRIAQARHERDALNSVIRRLNRQLHESTRSDPATREAVRLIARRIRARESARD